jgi:ribulose-5-phosphate 4-epimerase/fuculose-1-phosphate aldolase
MAQVQRRYRLAPGLAELRSNVQGSVSPEEWQIRVDLACAYRLVAHHGWDDLVFTHLSARIPGKEAHFLINPMGLMFEEVTASNLIKVDLAGKILSPTTHSINPAGFIIHSCIHAARHGVGAVFHTHTVAGVAVSAQKQGLLPITQAALGFYNILAYHDYEGLALAEAEIPRLLTDLGEHKALILRNHGLLSAGSTIGEAYLILFMLEKACQIQVAAQANGAELLMQPQAMADLVAKQTDVAFGFAAEMSWQAARRKMEKLDPGFKD